MTKERSLPDNATSFHILHQESERPIEELRFPLEPLTFAAKAWGPADGVPVIGLHGWMDNANTFDKVAPLLDGIRLVALDMAGHGRSDHRLSRMPYYIWEYGLDVLDVADALGWDTFGLLGHSLGGGVSTLVAGLAPERITRLMLIESLGPVSGDEEKMPQGLLKSRKAMQTLAVTLDRRAQQPDSPRFTRIEEAVERRLRSPLKLTREATEILIERGVHAVPGGFEWSHDQRLTLPTAVRMTETQIRSHIERITAPTVLVLGDAGLFTEDDPFKDKKRKSYIAERLPLFKSLEQRVLSGGHHLHLDGSPEAIAEIANATFR